MPLKALRHEDSPDQTLVVLRVGGCELEVRKAFALPATLVMLE
jgi:hypothetical protein